MRCLGLVFALATVAVPRVASAAAVEITYQGTVYGTDGQGLFGVVGGNLLGDAYTLSFFFDTSVGRNQQPSYDVASGGSFAGTPTPSRGAVLTINGRSASIAGAYSGQDSAFSYYNGSGNPSDPAKRSTSYYQGVSDDFGAKQLAAYVYSPNGGVPLNVDALFHYAVRPEDQTSGYFQFGASGNQNTFGGLNVATIDAISAVPLPASAPMFGAALVALGIVGCGLKRKAAVPA